MKRRSNDHRPSSREQIQCPGGGAGLGRLLASVIFIVSSACLAQLPPGVTTESESALQAGEKLARSFCAACHLFPEPDLLDKKTWAEQTLQRMRVRMGMAPGDLAKNPEASLIKAAGVIPELPMMSDDDYRKAAQYYLAHAPEKPLPQGPRAAIAPDLRLFQPEVPRFRHAPPSTTLVHISQPTRRIYFADAESKSLNILDANGRPLDTVQLDNVPVQATETARGLYMTMVGHFLPAEEPLGSLAFLQRTNNTFQQAKTFLKKMPRWVHTEFVDLNRDGKADLVASLFGNFAGRLSWFENLGRDEFKEHILIPKPGAVRTVTRDFDGDGTPDIAALIAQETESLFIFFNDGKGGFRTHTVFQKPPVYGHTSFEAADFNSDGKPDFLVTNGDNGEYASPLKKYHGVRIYLNKGGQHFEEMFFYPLNGAFKAMARDFDADGDLDIAAISFFPDYEKSPQESFVFLENKGSMTFTASSFREALAGRWLTMDAGDLDGDGDLDLVLGSYIRGPSDVPEALAEKWEAAGPSVLILRNKLRNGP